VIRIPRDIVVRTLEIGDLDTLLLNPDGALPNC
jgi:hypothetical protein